MDGKILVLMLMMVGGLGLGAWMMTTSAVDTARTELLEVQTLTTSTKTTMASRSKALEMKRQEYEARQALEQQAADLAAKVDDLTKQIDSSKQKIADLKLRRFDLQKQMAQTIQEVRVKSVGLVVGAVPLKSGNAPDDSKITKVEEGVLTLSHGQGMMKIPASQLPDPLMDRLRLSRPEAQEPTAPLLTPDQ
jgi:TolA-binding protein